MRLSFKIFLINIYIFYIYISYINLIQNYEKYKNIDRQTFIRSKKHRCLNYFTDYTRIKNDIINEHEFYKYMKNSCYDYHYDIFKVITDNNIILYNKITNIVISITILNYLCFS